MSAEAGFTTTDADAFLAALQACGGTRLLGLDIGTKTIGLATADLVHGIVTARDTLKRTKATADMAVLGELAGREGVAGLVAGLPLSMDGGDTPRTQSVRAQARNIAQALGRPLLLWDERWSTVAVERMMVEADLSRAKRAKRVDALAAAHILEGAVARLRAGMA